MINWLKKKYRGYTFSDFLVSFIGICIGLWIAFMVANWLWLSIKELKW